MLLNSSSFLDSNDFVHGYLPGKVTKPHGNNYKQLNRYFTFPWSNYLSFYLSLANDSIKENWLQENEFMNPSQSAYCSWLLRFSGDQNCTLRDPAYSISGWCGCSDSTPIVVHLGSNHLETSVRNSLLPNLECLATDKSTIFSSSHPNGWHGTSRTSDVKQLDPILRRSSSTSNKKPVPQSSSCTGSMDSRRTGDWVW